MRGCLKGEREGGGSWDGMKCCGLPERATGCSHALSWMEACLKEELPSPVELEESLRNGVLLAKLGHCFAPSVVPLKKIYDAEQLRYQVGSRGLYLLHSSSQTHSSQSCESGMTTQFIVQTWPLLRMKRMLLIFAPEQQVSMSISQPGSVYHPKQAFARWVLRGPGMRTSKQTFLPTVYMQRLWALPPQGTSRARFPFAVFWPAQPASPSQPSSGLPFSRKPLLAC